MMKIRPYPLQVNGMVKTLGRLFEKTLEATRPIQDLASGLKACAEQLKALTIQVAALHYNQTVHNQAIQQVWAVQQHINRKLSENALDVSLPDIDAPPNADPKDAALDARKRAGTKPN